MPSLHSNLARIEFTLDIAVTAAFLLARSLASISPGEVVKVPEGICGED